MEKRYSIQGATIEQIKDVGGIDIKEASRVGIVFATLEERVIAKLQALGCKIAEISEVKAPQVMAPIVPPMPLPATAGYSLLELLQIIGFNEDFRNITEPPIYGEGTHIAIIDSGIRETHEKINDSVVYSENFTADPMSDAYDHGTGVAYTALQVAPQCKLLNLKVLDSRGCGTDENVSLAIDKVIEISQHFYPLVINLSLGKPDDGNYYCPVRTACRAAIDSGIYVVAAAGNQGPQPGSVMSPACEPYVLAIGSVGYHPEDPRYPLLLSDFSGRGPTVEGLIKPDGLLPGENLSLASSASDTAQTVKSGTSFATPIASAMLALHCEAVQKQITFIRELPGSIPGVPIFHPIASQRLIDFWLPRICLKPDFAPMGKDNDYGYGIPYGGLMAEALISVAGGAGADQITSMIAPLLTIAMTGAFISGITRELAKV